MSGFCGPAAGTGELRAGLQEAVAGHGWGWGGRAAPAGAAGQPGRARRGGRQPRGRSGARAGPGARVPGAGPGYREEGRARAGRLARLARPAGEEGKGSRLRCCPFKRASGRRRPVQRELHRALSAGAALAPPSSAPQARPGPGSGRLSRREAAAAQARARR